MTSAEGELDRFRPRLVLRFGITGHRPPRLDKRHYDQITDQCAELFNTTWALLVDLDRKHRDTFAPLPPQLKLISSLAEGADVLAAEAALKCDMVLAACLPFPEEIYAQDFGEEEWARTHNLIERAGTVMALSDVGQSREEAYEIAGNLVLSQCDILIAVWDGEVARGRGGTAAVVADAVARHQPVIHIDASGIIPPQLLWSGLHDAVPDRPSLDAVERVDAGRALPALVSALCSPPQEGGLDALRDFCGGEAVTRKRFWSWPMMLALTGAKSLRKTSFRSPTAAECGDGLRPHIDPFRDHGRFGRLLNSMIRRRFGRADAKAGYYSLRFRSSFVANFAMAGIAVFLALAGLLAPNLKSAAIAAELLVILLIIANTHGANRLNLHQSWLNARHLAERLRMLAMSAPLGRLSLRDVENGTTQPGWVSWYARATARELGLVETDIDKKYLQKVRQTMLDLIDEQVAYHRRNAVVMHRADHRLHGAGDWLFFGTILACVSYLAVALLPGVPKEVWRIEIAALATFVTALFPALAAALYGIRMQGDLAATGERSATMARQLDRLRSAIEGDPISYPTLVERNRRLGGIMLAEVQQWQLQYETKPLSLPG